MKKAILSLIVVLVMFAGIPTFASPVADSASEVATNESFISEPILNFTYQSQIPDLHAISDSIWDAREVKERTAMFSNYILKPGERKVVEYVQLSKGQKLKAGIMWYSMIMSDGSKKEISNCPLTMTCPLSFIMSKEVSADKDGYYFIEYTAPIFSNMKQYELTTATIAYGKSN